MSFLPSSEQIELRDSLRRFLSETVTSDYLRQRFEAPVATDPLLWSKLIEFGLLELFLDETACSARNLAMVALECGRVLLPESLVDTVAIMRKLPLELRQQISSGQKRLAIGKLEFEKVRFCAYSANCAVVGISENAIYLYSKISLEGIKGASAVDRTQLYSDINISSSTHLQLPDELRADFLLAHASEMVGIGQTVHTRTLEYAKTRKQFGVPIGSFQAISHRLADMLLRIESAQSLIDFAAWALQDSPTQSSLALLAARSHIFNEIPRLIEESIQIHGGIGFTWEYDLHFYLRRAKFLEALWSPSENELLAILDYAQNS